jgi:hypothetical protein
VIGLWVGDGGEGAKYWHQVLGEIKNRAANDVLFLVCDGLRGLVEAVADVWPLAIVQNLRAAPRAQHLPLREQSALVRARPRPAPCLHRRHRASSDGWPNAALSEVSRQHGGKTAAGRVPFLPDPFYRRSDVGDKPEGEEPCLRICLACTRARRRIESLAP